MIQILNKKECDVRTVGVFCGRLYYTTSFWGKAKTNISHVIVINSKTQRHRNAWGANDITVTSNVDIYTTDGRVIEILTDDRQLLQQCLKYTTTKNPRDYYRNQRGI